MSQPEHLNFAAENLLAGFCHLYPFS